MLKVIVKQTNSPLPVRTHDWVAYIDGQEEDGPYGYGSTDDDAKRDLSDLSEQVLIIKGFPIVVEIDEYAPDKWKYYASTTWGMGSGDTEEDAIRNLFTEI